MKTQVERYKPNFTLLLTLDDISVICFHSLDVFGRIDDNG